jgi:LETM1-like protein.
MTLYIYMCALYHGLSLGGYSDDMLYLMLFSSPYRLIHKNVSPEGSEKPKSTKLIKQYALSRYMQLVKSYEKVLEKKFPTAMHVYRIFMVGIKDFYRDMKYYFKIYRRLSTPAGFTCLTRKEIELYHQMPKDMMRVAPMLILSTLPFANYIVLPLV